MNSEDFTFQSAGIWFVEEVMLKTRHSKAELSHLAKQGLLRPLAYPLPTNAKRLYARVTVESYLNSVSLLEKARKALLRYHKEKNASRKQNLEKGGASSDESD